jgi:hypothetical protein
MTATKRAIKAYDEAGDVSSPASWMAEHRSTIESKRLAKLPRLDSNQQPFG